MFAFVGTVCLHAQSECLHAYSLCVSVHMDTRANISAYKWSMEFHAIIFSALRISMLYLNRESYVISTISQSMVRLTHALQYTMQMSRPCVIYHFCC